VEKFCTGFRVVAGLGVALHFLDGGQREELARSGVRQSAATADEGNSREVDRRRQPALISSRSWRRIFERTHVRCHAASGSGIEKRRF
jgi:hypothetical protein